MIYLEFLKVILDFLSRIAWPAVVTVIVFLFREQFGGILTEVKALIPRIMSFELGKAKVTLGSQLRPPWAAEALEVRVEDQLPPPADAVVTEVLEGAHEDFRE